MNLLFAIAFIVAAVAVAVTTLLFVRRSAPEGSFFADGDRAAGVFGVLATGFSVLLGLVVFLAFTSYDQSRSGAETEAILISQQFEEAQSFPASVRVRLGNQLICYARSVVHQEWPRMESGTEGDALNPWGLAMFKTLQMAAPSTFVEQEAYDKFLDRRADREIARRDRIHGAAGVIPAPLWIVLFFISAVIELFMLLFADSAEHAFVQAAQIGAVVAVITATLLLIDFLDNPVRAGYGALRPTAMERTIRTLAGERRLVHQTGPLPCNQLGAPIPS
jgi:hypothetical protein